MGATILYKYLDFNGGLMMLQNSNIQFTNPKQLNDPFDCHPSLINYFNVPENECKRWPKEMITESNHIRCQRNRDRVWICSLSKIYDSILMWSYYGQHKGICIGLNMEKSRQYLNQVRGELIIGCDELEVQYKDIIDKPDYYKGVDFSTYQLSTKAKAWEHEQEVRLVMYDPLLKDLELSSIKNKTGLIDIKDLRTYPKIGGECFESIYMGVNIDTDDKSQIIDIARKLNPDIKIYIMKIDENAFKLNPKLIDE